MKIITYGDSITDAGRAGFPLGHGYALMVAAQLQSEVPQKYEIINQGISGHRIVDLYARVKRDVWNHNPDVMSILIGINDIWHDLGDEPNGVDLVRFERVYRMLIEDTLARLPDLKIMIMEPFVLKGGATEAQFEKFLEVKKYAQVAKQIAKDYNLVFVPLQDKLDELSSASSPEVYAPDGVHPSPAGAYVIAQEWIKAFKENIDK